MIPLRDDSTSASRPAVTVPLGLFLYTAQLRASVVLILVLQVLSTAADSAAAARFALTWAAS
jgi:hypothetical protein